MKKKDRRNAGELAAVPAAPAAPAFNSAAVALVTVLAGLHLIFAAVTVINYLSHRALVYEGTHAQFAWQAAEGHRLYGPDDIHYQQLWYNPLTFQIAGFVAKPFGYDIRAMRFAVGIFGCSALVLIGLITFQLTRNRWLAFVATALYCGIDAGPWFIFLEPNALHVCFAALAVFLFVRDPDIKWSTVLLATFSLFLSNWSKQTGLAYIAAGIFYLLTRDMKKGLAAAGLSAVLVVGSTLYYHLQPDSTYIEMTFSHGNQPIMWSWLLTPALFPELLGRFGILLAVIAAGIFTNTTRFKDLLRVEYIFLGAAAVVGIFARLKYGSGPAQAIFFYGMIIACGVTLLYDLYRSQKLTGPILLAILSLQSLALIHNYKKDLITDADDRRFKQVLDIMATPGKVTYTINQGFYNILVGKEPFANVGRDCWYKGKYDRSRYPAFWRKFVESDPFEIVVIDVPLEDNSWLLYERLNVNYVPVSEINSGPNARNKQVVFYRKDQMPQTAGAKPPGGS